MPLARPFDAGRESIESTPPLGHGVAELSHSVLPISTRAILLTGIAMVAFAANSLLCRSALGQGLIDASSFASIRVLSGAAVLWLFMIIRKPPQTRARIDLRATAMLLFYMVFFAFAYRSLSAGTGALILFGAVQLTMFARALQSGEHFPILSWAGFIVAFAGLVYLVLPGVRAPDPTGAVLMALAGMAWGSYSLLGRGSVDALGSTARNFALAAPPALLLSLVFMADFNVTPRGLILAVLSGAIASGCGYVIWYAALPGLTATRAATAQLTVPVIAALGGALVLAEPITPRLAIASVATLGGVAIVLSRRTVKPAAR